MVPKAGIEITVPNREMVIVISETGRSYLIQVGIEIVRLGGSMTTQLKLFYTVHKPSQREIVE